MTNVRVQLSVYSQLFRQGDENNMGRVQNETRVPAIISITLGSLRNMGTGLIESTFSTKNYLQRGHLCDKKRTSSKCPKTDEDKGGPKQYVKA